MRALSAAFVGALTIAVLSSLRRLLCHLDHRRSGNTL
jgi:hypothetical protein